MSSAESEFSFTSPSLRSNVVSSTASAGGGGGISFSSVFSVGSEGMFLVANSLTLASFFSFYEANAKAFASSFAFDILADLSATFLFFPYIQAVNLFSASSSEKAPFLTPSNRCFFIKIPL